MHYNIWFSKLIQLWYLIILYIKPIVRQCFKPENILQLPDFASLMFFLTLLKALATFSILLLLLQQNYKKMQTILLFVLFHLNYYFLIHTFKIWDLYAFEFDSMLCTKLWKKKYWRFKFFWSKFMKWSSTQSYESFFLNTTYLVRAK